jgi:cytochrome b6-f complex iron-sulfur subunit
MKTHPPDGAGAGAAAGPADAAGRRSVLRWLISGFLSLWGVAAAGLGLSFLRAPGAERRPGEGQVRCGPLETLQVGSARFIPHGAEPLVIVRAGDDQIVALSAVCTHMRCILRWDNEAQGIVCPCHDGRFDRNGNTLSGPPIRALRQYPVDVQAGEIVVRVAG